MKKKKVRASLSRKELLGHETAAAALLCSVLQRKNARVNCCGLKNLCGCCED